MTASIQSSAGEREREGYSHRRQSERHTQGVLTHELNDGIDTVISIHHRHGSVLGTRTKVYCHSSRRVQTTGERERERGMGRRKRAWCACVQYLLQEAAVFAGLQCLSHTHNICQLVRVWWVGVCQIDLVSSTRFMQPHPPCALFLAIPTLRR